MHVMQVIIESVHKKSSFLMTESIVGEVTVTVQMINMYFYRALYI